MATVSLCSEPQRLIPSGVAAPEMAEVAVVSVDGFALGDYEVAFARLYRRAYDVAFQLVGSRAEAEDVAQEAMARAFIHWAKVHGYAEPWVVRVAGNLAIGSWRKNRRLVSLADADADAGGDSGSHDHVDGRPGVNIPDHLALRHALSRLPKRQREVVVLRHLAGYSERETALALGCSNGTIKQHSSRGLAALRERLSIDLSDDDSFSPGEPSRRDGAAMFRSSTDPLAPTAPWTGSADADRVDERGLFQIDLIELDPMGEGER